MTDKGLWSSRVAGAMSHLAVLLFALCRLKAVERRREAVQQPLLLQSTLPLHHHVNNTSCNHQKSLEKLSSIEDQGQTDHFAVLPCPYVLDIVL